MTDGDQQATRWDGEPATQQGDLQPPGPAPKKTVPRALFNVVLALFVVSLLVIAALVVLKPFKASNSASSQLGLGTPSSGSSAPAGGSTSPSASAPASASAAPTGSTPATAASSAPPPTSGTSLFTQQPVQANDASIQNGAVQIGTTAYPDSIRFTCYTGQDSPTSVVYDTAGFTFLNATLGIPSDATNAAGNTMNITFFKDGTTDQLGKTLTTALDSPVQLHLNLEGASQLSIACQATSTSSSDAVAMDVAFGNAVLVKS
jgi:hypothetical protein